MKLIKGRKEAIVHTITDNNTKRSLKHQRVPQLERRNGEKDGMIMIGKKDYVYKTYTRINNMLITYNDQQMHVHQAAKSMQQHNGT